MEKKLTPPPAVKNTGIEWLGEIPQYWDVLPGYSLMRERSEKNVGLKEDTILSLSYGQVIIKPKDKLHGLVPESFETYQIVNPGNVIIRPTDLQNDKTSLRVGLAKNRGIITSAYLCLETSPRLLPEFAYNLLHSYDVMKIFYGLGSGLRQNLDFKDIKRLPLILPPLEEQQKIVSFIQQQERRIRKFIRNKKRLIGLLVEEKQAQLDALVLQGVNPEAEMKPSGIPFVGAVPSHWLMPLCGRVFREELRSHGELPEQQLSLSQKDGLIPTANMKERSLQTSTYDNWKLTLPDDLVLNRFKAHLGVFFASKYRGIVSFHYGVFKPRIPLVTKYFELLFHSTPYRVIFAGRSNGMTVGLQNLSNQNFYAVRALLPPVAEQSQIVSRFEEVTADLSAAVDAIRRDIILVQEYHSRLVADAVTGKIDLGNFQPSDEAESPDREPVLFIGESEELTEDYNEDEALLAEAVNAN